MPLIKITENIIKILSSDKLNWLIFENFEVFYWGRLFNTFKKNITLKYFINNVEGDVSCIIKKGKNIYLYRTFPGTVPLYYSYIKDSLYISDRFSQIPDLIPNSEDIIKKIFSNTQIDSETTLFKDVYRLVPECIFKTVSNKKYALSKYKNPCENKSLRELITQSINKRKNLKNALLLSEGTDSNVIWSLSQGLKSYSVIFDKKGENIITNRVKDKDHYFYYPFRQSKNNISKDINSIDYIFNPNTEVFRPLLQKMRSDNMNTVFFGIGGDEIQGRDQTFNLLRDYLYRFKILTIWKKRRFLKEMLKRKNFCTFRGSFLKGSILNYINSSVFLFNIEMIYNILDEYDLFPAYPLLDKTVLCWFLDQKYNNILEFGRDPEKLKPHLCNITGDSGIKVSFNSFLIELFDIKVEFKDYRLYNKKVKDISYSKWRKNVNKKKYKKV